MSSLTMNSTRPARLRIIMAIAGKDIVDALRNKTTLTVMIGVAMVMLTGSALPLLLKVADRQRIGIYDAGSSSEIVASLRQAEGVQVYPLRDEEALRVAVGESNDPGVGVVLPSDLPAAPAGSPLVLDAYMGHWLDAEQMARSEVRTVAVLEEVLDRPVTLNVRPVYPRAEPDGDPLMMGLSFSIVLLLISVMLVPLLIIEEKENHTLETLLVSPATMSELVTGKALAGMVYGVAGAAVFLAFQHAHVVHWGVAVLTVLAGGLFGTCLGLLLGVLFEEQSTLNLWVGVMAVLLIGPVFAQFIAGVPAWLETIFAWLPGTVLVRAFWLSLAETVKWTALLRQLAPLLGATALLFGLILVRLRRFDR